MNKQELQIELLGNKEVLITRDSAQILLHATEVVQILEVLNQEYNKARQERQQEIEALRREIYKNNGYEHIGSGI